MSHTMMTMAANPLSNSPLTQTLGASTKKLTAADGGTATTGSGGKSSSTSSSTDSIGTTFLSLLVQELQNQDPTAPMDSTAMVGQMISLNQLDQLTSINQTLANAYGSTSSKASGSSSGTSASGSGSTSGAAANQAVTSAATAAAMRLLAGSGITNQPGVSTSVSLPAL